MPGINLLFGLNDNKVDSYNSMFMAAQKTILHSEQYHDQLIPSKNNCIIGVTKYANYPVRAFAVEKYLILVEGIIYNKKDAEVQAEIVQMISALNSGSGLNEFKEKIRRFFLNSDGPFNIVIYDQEKNNLYYFNDSLGRLSLYFYQHDDFIVISREINFINPFLAEIAFDRELLAEYLLFSTVLGDETLVSNVRKLSAGSLIEIVDGHVNIHVLNTYNLDENQHAAKSIKQNALALKDIFIKACQDRLNALKELKTFLSLSGGLDSRSVAGALHIIGQQCLAATEVNLWSNNPCSDVKIAEKISKQFDFQWKVYDGELGVNEIENILRFKGPLNSLPLSSEIKYYQFISGEYGHNISYWTGDEGNATIADNTPEKKIHDVKGLADYIIFSMGMSRLELIKDIFDVDVHRIKNRLTGILNNFPEKNMDAKYLHFYLLHLNFKQQFEGEDRNRQFFWSVAPLYSLFFFKYVINIPNNQKKHHKLYKEFMFALNPSFTQIDNANWGYSLNSFKMKMFIFKKELVRFLPISLRKLLKSWILRAGFRLKENYQLDVDPAFKNYLINAYKKSPFFSNEFARSGLVDLGSYDLSTSETWNMLTILAFVNKTIKQYQDKKIIVK